VRTAAEAVRFLDAAGCCLLFPVRGLPLPSMYYAVARRDIRLGPGWDKYCELIWEWKDDLPRRRRAFYAKYFRGRGTFISLALLPHFLAMRGAAAGDFDRLYAEGRLSDAARRIGRALAEHGPLATLELRHACRMESKAANIRFKRAMLELQGLLGVTHFGAEQETAAWPSARFELTARAFPRQVAAARRLSPEQARRAIAAKYLEWHPEASPAAVARLFGWTRAQGPAALPAARQ
jgi:hypothetical protein